MNTYDCWVASTWASGMPAPPRPIERIKAEDCYAARSEYAERHGLHILQVVGVRIWKD